MDGGPLWADCAGRKESCPLAPQLIPDLQTQEPQRHPNGNLQGQFWLGSPRLLPGGRGSFSPAYGEPERASTAGQEPLTSLSRLVAHSSDSSGDLEMEDALVCMMGLKDHTLMTPSTSRLATLLPEQSTLDPTERDAGSLALGPLQPAARRLLPRLSLVFKSNSLRPALEGQAEELSRNELLSEEYSLSTQDVWVAHSVTLGLEARAKATGLPWAPAWRLTAHVSLPVRQSGQEAHLLLKFTPHQCPFLPGQVQ